jgi:hypothetical protein
MKNELQLYLERLERSYNRLSFEQQRALRVRTVQIILVGLQTCSVCFFYQYIPQLIRVFAFPISLIGAWMLAGFLAKEPLENYLELLNSKRISPGKNAGRRMSPANLNQARSLPVLGGLVVVACLTAGILWGRGL